MKYDIDLLNIIIKRDESKLIGEYDSLNVYSVINFQCKCGKEGSKKFRSLHNKGGAFCEACAKENGRKKAEATTLSIYGVKNAFASKDIQNKISSKYKSRTEEEKKQIIEKRKQVYYLKSEEEKKKIKDNINKGKSSRTEEEKKQTLEKIRKRVSLMTEEEKNLTKEKRKATFNAKYGVDNPFQSQEIKDKIKGTMLKTYGIENPMMNIDFKDKMKTSIASRTENDRLITKNKREETNKNIYGTKYATQSVTKEEWDRRMNKRVQTNLERFGYENPAQHPEIFEKIQESAKRFKPYTMPSGKIRKIQGYEGFALDELVKIYMEDQIKTDRKDVGRIKYILNDKTKYYYPDIAIPHENKLIEIKSHYTYTLDPTKIKCKGDACKSLGINYEIWIYNRKGDKEIITF
jgi:hypothetical protein